MFPKKFSCNIRNGNWRDDKVRKSSTSKSCSEAGWCCDLGHASAVKSSSIIPRPAQHRPGFNKQLNFATSAVEATRRPGERLNCCSHLLEQQTAWPGVQPPDDGWRAAGNEHLYQAALSSSSRSRQARFLSNCIGFSNFLSQDKWIEILRGEGRLLSATLWWLLLMIHLVFRARPDACWLLLSVHRGFFTFL